MDFSSAPRKLYDVAQILEQGIAIDTHNGQNSQREQGHGHDDDFDGAGNREPHQLRVACQNQQEPGFHGVPQLQHPAQYLAGIGV